VSLLHRILYYLPHRFPVIRFCLYYTVSLPPRFLYIQAHHCGRHSRPRPYVLLQGYQRVHSQGLQKWRSVCVCVCVCVLVCVCCITGRRCGDAFSPCLSLASLLRSLALPLPLPLPLPVALKVRLLSTCSVLCVALPIFLVLCLCLPFSFMVQRVCHADVRLHSLVPWRLHTLVPKGLMQ
jgi:hypothetical protein